MSKIKTILILLTVLPHKVLAGIVPCDGSKGNECNLGALGQMFRNIIEYSIQVGLVLAAVSFAYAGWLFMSANGDSGKLTQAKNIFWRVLIGVILVMSAFLIVQIILSSLGFTEEAGQWINKFINK